MSSKLLAKNFIVVSLLFALSSVLGLVRETAVAYKFGASGQTDAFLIAMIIPTLFINLVKVSITSTFISVFTRYLVANQTVEGWEMVNSLISFLLILTFGLLFFLFLFTQQLVHLFAPSYVGPQLELAVNLTRILLPSIVFGTLTGVFVGINNASDSFIAPALVGLVSNVIMIFSVFFLGSWFGINGLAIGSLVGIVAQFLIQVPPVTKQGFSFHFRMDLTNSGLIETMQLVTPFIISAAANQVNLIVDRTLATGLNQGMVSSLYFANKLVLLPQNIFSGAIGMLVFPILSRAAAKKDWDGVIEGLQRSVRLLTMVLFPAAVGILILRYPLVKLLFEHGAFTSANTRITANTLVYLLGTLYFGGIAIIFINLLFSLKKVSITVGAIVITVVVNISLSLLLIHPLQQNGLALANSVSAGVNLVILMMGAFYVIRKNRPKIILFPGLGTFCLRICLATGVMALGLIALIHSLGRYFNSTLALMDCVILLVIMGVVMYVTVASVLKMEEISEFYGIFKIRLKKNKLNSP